MTNEKMQGKSNCIWWLTVGITVALVLACLSVAILVPSPYQESYMGELEWKLQHLEETEGQRVIVIGGSAAAFGMDSAMVEACLNDTASLGEDIPRPDDLTDSNCSLHAVDDSGALSHVSVVNFGMYGGLGNQVMLELADAKIRSGDVVILMPEMNAQSWSDYFGPTYYLQGLAEHPKYFFRLSDSYKGQVIGTLPRFALDKVRRLGSPYVPEEADVYRRNSFNAYGDVDTNLAGTNVMPDGVDTVTPVDFSEELLDSAFVETSNTYATKWQKRGATVYFAYCPLNGLAISDENEMERFHSALQEKLTYPVLGTPADSVLDTVHFYDTNFHLNQNGRAYYTYEMLKNLKAATGDSRYTIRPQEWLAGRDGQQVPTEPRALHSVGSSEVADFTWVETSQGIRITGVTDAGRKAQSLVIPEAVDEVPVISVSDGIFTACKDLREIHVEARSAEQITVGQGLLDGTRAQVYVPQASLEAYRLNYFWSTYGDRLHGEE